MESIQATKQRFGIIGNDPNLNRIIEKAIRVAPTDISVLVTWTYIYLLGGASSGNGTMNAAIELP